MNISVPASMDLLYTPKSENLKKFSNWRKSEYFVFVYDAQNKQKNNKFLVSTQLENFYTRTPN